MLIPKTMGKMSPGHVRDLHGSPSHHRPRGPGGKSGFVGWAQGLCAVCSLGTWCPVSQLLQPWLKGANIELGLWLQRVEAPSIGSFHVMLSLWVQRCQELRFGNLCLDFRIYMETPGCPGKSLLQGQSPHGEPLLGQCGREMWGRAPTQSPCWGTA
ncbi:hCG1781136 [Homo sapiens]